MSLIVEMFMIFKITSFISTKHFFSIITIKFFPITIYKTIITLKTFVILNY